MIYELCNNLSKCNGCCYSNRLYHLCNNHSKCYGIDRLEEKTIRDIEGIKQEINDIKGDFATTFVLREDFFRSMNAVEDKVKSIDSKIDRLLLREGK